ncbi:hypothetical protein EDEG_02138 [Edhazardia aedis USNM 41457]|uniref:Uncharacterized protein n=1 Tax=Edhazardia aedis (strain USNM 41457) TaxID=1003232 RepID=J9D7U1_EDHAE|nr:hypothetical protein EDEG_02138 [Edhazardia aedis USNM 41457]|eukprot:EJW03554.1 hypothetical protein EDEG_02138 [Edhazardia aedis USNM 41457]
MVRRASQLAKYYYQNCFSSTEPESSESADEDKKGNKKSLKKNQKNDENSFVNIKDTGKNTENQKSRNSKKTVILNEKSQPTKNIAEDIQNVKSKKSEKNLKQSKISKKQEEVVSKSEITKKMKKSANGEKKSLQSEEKQEETPEKIKISKMCIKKNRNAKNTFIVSEELNKDQEVSKITGNDGKNNKKSLQSKENEKNVEIPKNTKSTLKNNLQVPEVINITKKNSKITRKSVKNNKKGLQSKENEKTTDILKNDKKSLNSIKKSLQTKENDKTIEKIKNIKKSVKNKKIRENAKENIKSKRNTLKTHDPESITKRRSVRATSVANIIQSRLARKNERELKVKKKRNNLVFKLKASKTKNNRSKAKVIGKKNVKNAPISNVNELSKNIQDNFQIEVEYVQDKKDKKTIYREEDNELKKSKLENSMDIADKVLEAKNVTIDITGKKPDLFYKKPKVFKNVQHIKYINIKSGNSLSQNIEESNSDLDVVPGDLNNIFNNEDINFLFNELKNSFCEDSIHSENNVNLRREQNCDIESKDFTENECSIDHLYDNTIKKIF